LESVAYAAWKIAERMKRGLNEYFDDSDYLEES
jgi:hypothetical protein